MSTEQPRPPGGTEDDELDVERIEVTEVELDDEAREPPEGTPPNAC